MLRPSILFAFLAATVSYVSAADTACSLDSHCPEASPCCSQYGACGVGAYCLGGCDPRSSFSLDSCVPEPVCESKTYTFSSMDGITDKAKFLGDASTTDWVMDGQALIYNDNVLLTMAPSSVGTVLATSSYLWYGNVKATFKTSRGQGVVTAFILLSDVKDEIDYEFVGVDLETAQTNYYFQGITDYGNSGNISLTDTFNNYHTYEIDWTPDTITWSVDGKVGRTKDRADTWNATSNQWDYPQTPARVQLSIWPGGLATNAQGTIDWAGGEIDWNSQDIQAHGYDYAMFQSVTVDCYNATKAPGTNSGVSYTYNNAAGTNNTVVNGDEPTVLKSLLGTGTNMSAGLGSSASATAETIPGLSGAGPGTDGHASESADGGASATGTSTSTASSAACSGFCQGISSSGSGSSSGAEMLNAQARVLKSSVFAGLLVVFAMIVL